MHIGNGIVAIPIKRVLSALSAMIVVDIQS